LREKISEPIVAPKIITIDELVAQFSENISSFGINLIRAKDSDSKQQFTLVRLRLSKETLQCSAKVLP